MKKLLLMIALFALPLFALTGCGRSGDTTVIDGASSVEPAMTDDQMTQYEEEMSSGSSGSSAPGN
jgi:predicted small lipoprotein YifL